MEPREVLGIGPDAGEEEIRAAYVRGVKEHPPDRSPERFERIRDAYEALRDPRRRMRDTLLAADPLAPLAAVIEIKPRPRSFTSIQLWLEVLKAK